MFILITDFSIYHLKNPLCHLFLSVPATPSHRKQKRNESAEKAFVTLCSIWQSRYVFVLEAYHQLQYNLILFRFFGNAMLGVEIFLVVQSDITLKSFAKTEGNAARHTMTFVVGSN